MAQNLLSGPQKLVIDAERNRLLISNYYTSDIVEVDSLESQTYFLQNAHFVDGMEIVGNVVYGVGAEGRITGYDLDTKLETLTATIPGFGYLSSVVADSSGFLYISRPIRNSVYKMRISDGTYWVFEGSGAMNKPNGMIFQEAAGRLVVIEDRAHPSILAIDMADSTVTTLATTNLAGGDGIAQDAAGNYYVTGYYLPGVYKFDPAFSQPPVMIYEADHLVYPTYDARDNSLLVTGWDGNVWVRIPLGTTDAPSTEAVGSIGLGRAAPNPFTLGTSMRFALSNRAHARLDVYDVRGSRVATLVDGTRGPGSHSVAWDGRSDSGERAAGGVYYFRLSADGRERTRSAVLLR
jgi:hypothetical protein